MVCSIFELRAAPPFVSVVEQPHSSKPTANDAIDGIRTHHLYLEDCFQGSAVSAISETIQIKRVFRDSFPRRPNHIGPARLKGSQMPESRRRLPAAETSLPARP